MCRTIGQLREAAEKIAGELEPDLISPRDAVRLLEEVASLKKTVAALEAHLAARVARSGNWRFEGDKSAAEFVSRRTGETVGKTVDLLNTAERLRRLPETDKAFRSGRLSQAQASEIAHAATVAPQSEDQLIKVAETQGLAGVREAARRVEAAALKDHAARAKRLHDNRYCRTWVDRDGSFKLAAQLTPEAGAEVQAVLDALRKDLLKKARSQARKATPDGLGADALVEMARSSAAGHSGSRVKAEVKVRVDLDALKRGYPAEGEVCEAQGAPVPVGAVGEFLSNAVVKLVGLEGSDVTRVQHAGRYVPSKLKTAVEEKYAKCVIAGCGEKHDLQLDHTVALGDNGRTSIGNLKPFCVKHHRMKHGPYMLVEEKRIPGTYRLVKLQKATAWDAFKTDPSPP